MVHWDESVSRCCFCPSGRRFPQGLCIPVPTWAHSCGWKYSSPHTPSCAGQALTVLRDKPMKQRRGSARRAPAAGGGPLEAHPRGSQQASSSSQRCFRNVSHSIQGSRARGRESQPACPRVRTRERGLPHPRHTQNFLLPRMGRAWCPRALHPFTRRGALSQPAGSESRTLIPSSDFLSESHSVSEPFPHQTGGRVLAQGHHTLSLKGCIACSRLSFLNGGVEVPIQDCHKRAG